MHNDFIIRIATLEDLAAMVKVGDKLFDNKIKPNRAKEFLEDPRHHLLIAYYHGKIVGIASAFHYVHPDKDPALFINEVGVIDDFQNKGIARNLVWHMKEHGKSLGCTECWVATEKSNLAAQKAYLAAGGKEDPESIVMYNFPMD